MILPIVLLLLAAFAECAPQLGLMALNGATWRKVSSKFVEPVYRKDAKREIVRYGPLELYGKSAWKGGGAIIAMDPNGQAGVVTINEGICKGCSIVSARFSLSYENGTEANPTNGVYIHHFVSYDSYKADKDPLVGCHGGFYGMGAPFLDRGEDSGHTDTVFTPRPGMTPVDSGYHMDSGSLIVQYDMVNYAETTKKVYINLEYEWKPHQSDKDVSNSLKSVTCNGVIPPRVSESGPAVTSSIPMLVTRNTEIIWARGHLHAGGVKMTLNVNGQTVCESTPTYNSKGVITNMSLCPKVIPLTAGSYVTISSEYDLTKHHLREATSGHGGASGKLGGSDVMGMFAFSYAG